MVTTLEFFSCGENFYDLLPQNFQIYNNVLLTVVTMLYIISPELTLYLEFLPFEHIHPFHLPPSTPVPHQPNVPVGHCMSSLEKRLYSSSAC